MPSAEMPVFVFAPGVGVGGAWDSSSSVCSAESDDSDAVSHVDDPLRNRRSTSTCCCCFVCFSTDGASTAAAAGATESFGPYCVQVLIVALLVAADGDADDDDEEVAVAAGIGAVLVVVLAIMSYLVYIPKCFYLL